MKNRYLVADVNGGFQSAIQQPPKCKICTFNCTLEELAVLKLLKDNPFMIQKELAEHVGKSERTIKKITVSLQEKGIMERANGKRNGQWVICSDVNAKTEEF